MIEGVDHIGIAVRSIDEARGFYEALGLTIAAIEEVAQEKVRVAFIHCGGTRLELLEPTAEDSPVGRFLERRGPGVHHICLRTDDVQGAGDQLRDVGHELIGREPTVGAGGCWIRFVHPRTSGGVLFEISQPPFGEARRPLPRAAP